MPPPSASPVTPVEPTTPPGVDEPVLLRRRVEVEPRRAAGRARDARLGVDRDGAHARQVDHEPVVEMQCPAALWPPPRTATSSPCAPRTRTPWRRRPGRGSGRWRRPPVDHGVEAHARLVVAGLARGQDVAVEGAPQIVVAAAHPSPPVTSASCASMLALAGSGSQNSACAVRPPSSYALARCSGSGSQQPTSRICAPPPVALISRRLIAAPSGCRACVVSSTRATGAPLPASAGASAESCAQQLVQLGARRVHARARDVGADERRQPGGRPDVELDLERLALEAAAAQRREAAAVARHVGPARGVGEEAQRGVGARQRDGLVGRHVLLGERPPGRREPAGARVAAALGSVGGARLPRLEGDAVGAPALIGPRAGEPVAEQRGAAREQRLAVETAAIGEPLTPERAVERGQVAHAEPAGPREPARARRENPVREPQVGHSPLVRRAARSTRRSGSRSPSRLRAASRATIREAAARSPRRGSCRDCGRCARAAPRGDRHGRARPLREWAEQGSNLRPWD